MDGRASVGRDRDRDRDRDRPGNVPQHPTSPPPEPPLPRPLPLELRTAIQSPSQSPISASSSVSGSVSGPSQLPPLPESPMVACHPTITAHIASVIRPSAQAAAYNDPTDTPTRSRSSKSAKSAKSSKSTASSKSQPTIRAVTPEPFDHHKIVAQNPLDAGDLHSSSSSSSMPPPARAFISMSPQSSPRFIPGGPQHGSSSSRRQGVVFSDAVAGSFDSTSSNPSPRPPIFRPRTHTMDGASPFRELLGAHVTSEPRNRVGSLSSTGTADSSQRLASVLHSGPLDSLSYPFITSSRPLEQPVAPTSNPTGVMTASSSTASISSLPGVGHTSPVISSSASSKDKKGSSRRLIKRTSSRPTSPLISPPPSADSLLLPIPTGEANKIIMLMKTLCGRMRGSTEYRGISEDTWCRGKCYIEEGKGSLMFDAEEQSPFNTAIIPDLRGCRVLPVDLPDQDGRCLELVNAQGSIEIVIRPLLEEEFDLWLAALLCWQQLRPAPGSATAGSKASNNRTVSASGSTNASASAPELNKRRASAIKARDSTIIKVGKVMLWDRGASTTPRNKAVQTSWRRVSCILQGNGEFKFMTENDVTILSVIELTQLARCAIQQLDKSVLDEEYSIAIFPIYAPTSTQLSIFRPTFIALDSRVAFEVWYVLLRAFAVPSIYALDINNDEVFEVSDVKSEPESDDPSPPPSPKFDVNEPLFEELPRQRQLFRLEKSLNLRVTEAKIKPPDGAQESFTQRPQDRSHDKSGKKDQHDSLVRNYLAEVILDGEVRARTTTKIDTKNPFWREDCEFSDLPSTLPFLSIVLKSVDGLETYTHQLQASLGLPRSGNLREVERGSVDIPLSNLEKGKDHEQWLPIRDEDKQVVGSMLVKVYHEELAVLSASEYKELSDILHKFSSGLTLQIAEVMPSSLRRLAEVFLNIFQVSGFAGDWLMALVEDEIDGIGNQTSMKKMRFSRRLRSNESIESTSDRELLVRDMGKSLQGEANLLFRGNSLLTQSFEFHMRRLGKEYLEEVLSDKIFEINEINPDCEVDPSKIQAGEDLNKHWEQLMTFTSEVWECVAFSAQRFPPELRHILKYIRAVADDRYGDFLRTVAYTSVSGFLFLRFICPAILNPKLFGLLRDHPRPRAQRTLTLIAKGLQALANLTTIGKKETWMEPMNRFLGAQRNTLKDFIDAICSIPAEKPNTTALLPASYSTPITIMGRLSSTSREGFPSLPYLIDHPRNLAALVKLWMDAHPPSAPGVQVFEGDLLEFHKVCSGLQAKSDDCFNRADALRRAADGDECQFMSAEDSLSDRLERASLADSINLSYGNNNAWMDHVDAGGNSSNFVLGASHNRSGPLVPPGSSGSEMDDQWGREQKSRQMSFGSFSNHGPPPEGGGSIKILRNGKQARKFFSGIINRKPRTASPEHMDETLRVDREQSIKKRDRMPDGDLEKEREEKKEREREREKERERNRGENRVRSRDELQREKEKEKEKEKARAKAKEKEREKERNREREHKRTSSKDKSKKDKPKSGKDKADKHDKDKNGKSDKKEQDNNGTSSEPWSPSSFASADAMMRQPYNS